MLFYSLCITKFNRTHVIDALLVGGVCGSLPADGGLDILVHDQFVTVKLPHMAYAAFDPSHPLSLQRGKESTIVDPDCITHALPPKRQEEEQKETICIDYVSSHIGTFYLVDLPDDISLEISLYTSKGFQTDIIDIDVR